MLARVPIAFAAGFLSFLAPCVLPLVPGYLSIVSAVDPQRLGDSRVARRVAIASLPFVAGFAIVFVALGALTNVIARIMSAETKQAFAGFILVVAGLAFLGLLPWTDRLVAGRLLGGARSRGSRVLLGGAFAVCAAPCVGPLLGAAVAAASSSETVLRGSALLAAYAAGLGAAFVSVAIFFSRGMSLFRWMRDHYRWFSYAGGATLIVLGLLLFFDEFWRVQAYTHRALEAIGLGDL
jgi:cytochrome c-type biogenesis protein